MNLCVPIVFLFFVRRRINFLARQSAHKLSFCTYFLLIHIQFCTPPAAQVTTIVQIQRRYRMLGTSLLGVVGHRENECLSIHFERWRRRKNLFKLILESWISRTTKAVRKSTYYGPRSAQRLKSAFSS